MTDDKNNKAFVPGKPSEADGLNTDFVMGELSELEARQHERLLAQDPMLAREASEIRAMLQDFRDLSVVPTQNVPLRVRYAVAQRCRWRQQRENRTPMSWGRLLSQGLQMAAVAMLVCWGLVHLDRWQSNRVDGLEYVMSDPDLPIVEAPLTPGEFVEALPDPLAEPHPSVCTNEEFKGYLESMPAPASWSDLRGFLHASNELAALRREFRSRVSPWDRRRAFVEGGSSTALDNRIQDMAGDIAKRINELLSNGEATVAEVSLTLRALLAAGSSPRIGPHRESVELCGAFLEERVGQLEGEKLASALAGLMDLAIVTGRSTERLVGEHADRLAQSLFAPAIAPRRRAPVTHGPGEVPQRPALLNWQTSPSALADAGVVLRLAPAFGVNPRRASYARRLLAAHVKERIASTNNERPDLLAAELYGFGDLVDRQEADHKLLLWTPERLVPNHYVALHHLSWSQFPTRRGWARFQRGLRAVAVQKTPRDVRDASALLLALAMNYAAPGSSRIVAAPAAASD